MNNMINYGIDLGTTNSLIAKFNKGTVTVFKNPNGFRETLPSVVGFRNDRILIGDQAKVYATKDPKNVASRFKRKMGTTESFNIKAIGQSKTPVELSAFVLKQLKTFIHTGEVPEAVVITVPASFDMVQSNATAEAGYQAGFKQVVLLQEPIAASLAYANEAKDSDLMNSQWIVYDLGGGTFDVALVKIVEGELKVIDHEGNNFLGGADFDAIIVEKLIVPQLERRGKFTNLLAQLKSDTGRYNKLWYALLSMAEEAKIELSTPTKTSAEIDLSRTSVADEAGSPIDGYFEITRSEFEAVIKQAIDESAEMVKKILTRKSLRPQDLKFVLMVGGSTHIPFVRSRIRELLGIPVNTGIDPSNAIAVGAAYFAATKEITIADKSKSSPASIHMLKVRVSYARFSREGDEIFSARIEGNIADLFYRITREDGGFDSGLKKLTERITEDLPLQEDEYNLFTFKIFDSHNNHIPSDYDSIQIAQGKYPPAGQMLPEALSLVLDDNTMQESRLECIFEKNTPLPVKRKLTVEASKTCVHGSDDEIRIIVVEGPPEYDFMANKTIGHLVISGKSLIKDIFRHTEIDLSFDVSESRDLTVTAYVNPSGPELQGVFKPKFRDVPVKSLVEQIQLLEPRLDQEAAEAMANENYEVVEEIEKLRSPTRELVGEALLLTFDDCTDEKFKIEDKKRKISQSLSRLTAGKRIERCRIEYHAAKKEVSEIVLESGNDSEKRQLNELASQEHVFLVSQNPQRIKEVIAKLYGISWPILRRTPGFLETWFQQLMERRATLNDQLQAKNLIEAGKRHLAAEDYEKLAEVNGRLYSLLPQEEKEAKEMQHFSPGIWLK